MIRPFPRIPTGLGLGAALSKMLAMRVGVGNIWFKGTVRVAMKPLLDRLPLVGAVKVRPAKAQPRLPWFANEQSFRPNADSKRYRQEVLCVRLKTLVQQSGQWIFVASPLERGSARRFPWWNRRISPSAFSFKEVTSRFFRGSSCGWRHLSRTPFCSRMCCQRAWPSKWTLLLAKSRQDLFATFAVWSTSA